MFKCIALLILRALFLSFASDLRWLPGMAMYLSDSDKIFVTMLFPYLFNIYVYILLYVTLNWSLMLAPELHLVPI